MSILPAPGTPGFPQCAYNCAPFTGATAACLPPAAVQTNQKIYDSCFCQSAILQSFYSSPNGLCDAFCTNPSDLQQLQGWYQQFCAQVRAGQAPGGSTSSTLTTRTSNAANAPTGGPQAQSSDSINDSSPTQASSSSNAPPKGWFEAHWRWVVMVVVLFPLLILIGILGFWLRRRHRRKVDARRVEASGFVPPPPSVAARSVNSRGLPGQELWGPHQHMAHTRGWEYGAEEDADYVRKGGGPRLPGHEVVAAGLGRFGSTRRSRRRKESKGKGRAEDSVEVDEKEAGGSFSNSDAETGKKRHRKHRRHQKRPPAAKGAHNGDQNSNEPLSEKGKDALTPIPSREIPGDVDKDPDRIEEIR